ncbi:hypothetical protein G6F50_015592 [Rhizopus delemar]|uniref:Uncharacterized protein n=1 Tax=Rhizopus delemar TaxID=936053 RepID=A0A9P6XXG0_9FUNG|nr:hypothetical protein G6F50_015592 [Rhizopus delemar]
MLRRSHRMARQAARIAAYRHWSEFLAHRRADEGRRAIHPSLAARPGPPARGRAHPRRCLWLAGADRPRPRHRQGDPARPGRPAAEPDRPGHHPGHPGAHPQQQAHPADGAARDRLRREARPRHEQAPDAAVPHQRHALHRVQRRRRSDRHPRLLLRWWRLRGQPGRRGR